MKTYMIVHFLSDKSWSRTSDYKHIHKLVESIKISTLFSVWSLKSDLISLTDLQVLISQAK